MNNEASENYIVDYVTYTAKLTHQLRMSHANENVNFKGKLIACVNGVGNGDGLQCAW